MDEAIDITAPTQRFDEVALTLPPPTLHANLAPSKDGIVEVRQKGATLGLIPNCSPRSALQSGRTPSPAFSPK